MSQEKNRADSVSGRHRQRSVWLAHMLVGTGIVLAGATAWPGAVQAQPVVVGQDGMRQYGIEVGTLDQVLNRFAAESGIALAIDGALTADLPGPALSGRYDVAGGLAVLLAGSGLEAVRNRDGGYVLRRRSRQDVQALEAVTVRGQQEATEGSGSYTTGLMSTATPLALSIRETPQSVSVVTRDRMTDNGMTTVENALNYTTGMTVTSTASEREEYNARGFRVSNIMVDGLAMGHDYDVLGSGTLDIYDRIEVVRGATGLLEGAGNPSASINLVKKRPTADFRGSVAASYGRWHNRGTTLDAGGPLNEAGTLRGRVVTTLRDSDTFTSGYSRERRLFYGILEADITDRTTITLGGYHNTEDNPGADWNGLPTRADGSFYDFDRDVRASPYWSYWNKENTQAFAEVTHAFDNGWKIELKGSWLDGKLNMAGTSLLWARQANDAMFYNTGKYHYQHRQTALDLRASGPFELAGRNHQLAVGVNHRRKVENDGPGGWATAYPYAFDPADWAASVDAPEPAWSMMWSRESKEVQYGGYATAKFSLSDPLNLFLGGRLSWYTYDSLMRSGTYVGETRFTEHGKLTPYAALTYDLNEQYTVYGSVTGIFKPQDYTSAGGGLLDPVEGTNYEAGIKGEYLDGRLNASLAVFQINQTNLPNALPQTACSNTAISCYAAAGEVRSRGFEAELSGNVTHNWRIFAGYAYVMAKYLEDSTEGQAGSRYGTTTPRHLLTLSTVYSFDGALAGWRVGTSARIQGRTQSTVSGYETVRQPGYGIINLMAGYSPSRNLDFQLNVLNVFDRNYYRSISYPDNGNVLGEPRSWLLTARYSF